MLMELGQALFRALLMLRKSFSLFVEPLELLLEILPLLNQNTICGRIARTCCAELTKEVGVFLVRRCDFLRYFQTGPRLIPRALRIINPLRD